MKAFFITLICIFFFFNPAIYAEEPTPQKIKEAAQECERASKVFDLHEDEKQDYLESCIDEFLLANSEENDGAIEVADEDEGPRTM